MSRMEMVWFTGRCPCPCARHHIPRPMLSAPPSPEIKCKQPLSPYTVCLQCAFVDLISQCAPTHILHVTAGHPHPALRCTATRDVATHRAPAISSISPGHLYRGVSAAMNAAACLRLDPGARHSASEGGVDACDELDEDRLVERA
eukprot:2425729-Rhodomonas_salina.1